ncbi:cell division protein FtsL [Latilactobacillus graminis]|nr:cell division protein FtsL [Latilactobacillus graminis]
MMVTNTARQLETPVAPLETQSTIHKHAVISQSKKVAFSAVEKLVASIIGIVFFAMLVSLLTTKIAVVNAQRGLESTTQKMTQVSANNNDLKQEIGELTSSDRLNAFAQKHDLKLNENNIRNVSK